MTQKKKFRDEKGWSATKMDACKFYDLVGSISREDFNDYDKNSIFGHEDRFGRFVELTENVTVFKKACFVHLFHTREHVVVRMRLTPGTIVFVPWTRNHSNGTKSGFSVRKLRASAAKVIGWKFIDRNAEMVFERNIVPLDSSRRDGTEYVVGKTITPHYGFCNDCIECAGGIHVFLNRIEAENWNG